jgi:tRNA (guanine37-N1)-methyltransferase
MDRVVLVCGHYEGFDDRIRTLADLELSIGDYVLTGGELPAMVVIDAVTRLQAGALGAEDAAQEESFTGDLLEYPQYTRPREYRGMVVPEVLLSGNHAQIARWRAQQALERTRERRSDLLGECPDDI